MKPDYVPYIFRIENKTTTAQVVRLFDKEYFKQQQQKQEVLISNPHEGATYEESYEAFLEKIPELGLKPTMLRISTASMLAIHDYFAFDVEEKLPCGQVNRYAIHDIVMDIYQQLQTVVQGCFSEPNKSIVAIAENKCWVFEIPPSTTITMSMYIGEMNARKGSSTNAFNTGIAQSQPVISVSSDDDKSEVTKSQIQ